MMPHDTIDSTTSSARTTSAGTDLTRPSSPPLNDGAAPPSACRASRNNPSVRKRASVATPAALLLRGPGLGANAPLGQRGNVSLTRPPMAVKYMVALEFSVFASPASADHPSPHAALSSH